MQNLPVELPDALWLQGHFSEYANPKARIGRLVRQGFLYRLKRGLYITAEATRSNFAMNKAANRIYGPSYISFVYALRWYGLIPEHVVHITSATYKKGRTKRYDTPVGSFLYRDVPAAAYPCGICFVGDGRDRFLMASAEKALCDELYRISGIRSNARMEDLLFEDLRLDRFIFNKLNYNDLTSFASKYKTVTLETFIKFLERYGNG